MKQFCEHSTGQKWNWLKHLGYKEERHLTFFGNSAETGDSMAQETSNKKNQRGNELILFMVINQWVLLINLLCTMIGGAFCLWFEDTFIIKKSSVKVQRGWWNIKMVDFSCFRYRKWHDKRALIQGSVTVFDHLNLHT